MKQYVRTFLFHVVSLWFTSQILPALVIFGNWQTLLTAGLVLSMLMLIIRPILTILFIPINLLTLGFFSWFINVIVIYFLTILVPQVEIQAWLFPGASWAGFIMPPIYISYFFALVLSSLLITFFTNLFHQISED